MNTAEEEQRIQQAKIINEEYKVSPIHFNSTNLSDMEEEHDIPLRYSHNKGTRMAYAHMPMVSRCGEV